MILDTFYLLFKSDSAQAVKDVGELDKKVDTLRQTGKKQSEQQQKDAKESTKQHKEFNDSLKETGYQYTKIAESLAQATVAAVSFGSIAKGIFGTASSNSTLQVQSKLIGQSAVELRGFGEAAKAAGGDAESVTGYIQGLFERFSDVGLGSRVPAISKVFAQIREQLAIAGDDLGQREKVFQNFNVPAGLKPLLSESKEDYERDIALQLKLAEVTERAAATSREFEKAWAQTGSALTSIFSEVGDDVLPLFTSMNEEIQEFFGLFKDHEHYAEAFLLAMAGAAAVLTKSLIGLATSFLGVGTAAAAAETAVVAPAGAASVAAYLSGGGGAAAGVTAAGLAIPAAIVAGGAGLAYGAYKLSSNYGYGKNAKRSDPMADKKSALGIPTYPPEIEEQLKLGQIARAKRDLDFAGQSQAGVSNITVGGGGGRSISVKTGDIHVHSAASDATGIARDTATELEKQINMAISNMDDGVKY